MSRATSGLDTAVVRVAVVDDHESMRLGLLAACTREGVIPKASATAVATAAIRTVASGAVLNDLEWATAIDADAEFAKAQLSGRERDVLNRCASGPALRMVAEQLGRAPSTVREHLDRIRAKYIEVGRPAPTKVDLLRRAVEDGILPEMDVSRSGGVDA